MQSNRFGGKQYTLLLAVGLAFALAACSDSSSGSNGSDSSGTAENPADITVGEPLEGTVGAGESYYVTFNSGDGGYFRIDLENEDLSWTLYDDDSFSARGEPSHATVTDCPDGTCYTDDLDTDTDYYLEIVNDGDTEQDFALTVDEAPQGSVPGDPIVIMAMGDDSYTPAQSVAPGLTYFLLGMNSTGYWRVSVTNSGEVTTTPTESLVISLYSDADYESLDETEDTSDALQATTLAATNSLYIEIENLEDSPVTIYLYTENPN